MKKILILEDDMKIIEIIKDQLKMKSDFELVQVDDCHMLESFLKKDKYFAAICAMELEGFSNCKHIDIINEKLIPTILLSSNDGAMSINNIQKLGVFDYFYKNNRFNLSKLGEMMELLKFIDKKDVLLVNDSKGSMEYILKILNKLTLNVTSCESSKEALSLTKEKNFDLIIYDYNLHTAGALDFAKELKMDQNYLDTPLYMISSDNDTYSKVNALKNGADEFIVKPFLQDELKMKIIDSFKMIQQQKQMVNYSKMIAENKIQAFNKRVKKTRKIAELV